MKTIKLLTVIAVAFIAAFVSADVPNSLNYQGYLTDAVGDPVADGGYLVKFIIYDAPVGGIDLWNSGFQGVTTENGAFSYQLGSNVNLPSGMFEDTNRYLGITVGADPELTPRTKFNSAAYAFHAATAENLSGDLFVYDNNDTLRARASGNDGGFYIYGSLGDLYGQLYSFTWGELLLYDTDGDWGVDLGAGSSSGGFLDLYDPIGSNNIYLSAAGTGNSTVSLPDDAIDNTEILDEAGIAADGNSGTVGLTTTMQDIGTVSITIPTSGYIYVTGRCWARSTGLAGYNAILTQIDETAGGTYNSAFYTLSGPNDENDADEEEFHNVFADRVYFKSAGTYTFRLESRLWFASGSGTAGTARVTALFFPTAYGTVSTSMEQMPDGLESEMQTVTDPMGNKSVVYKTDLRQLELEAKEAALKAKEAELKLLKAQQQQNRN